MIEAGTVAYTFNTSRSLHKDFQNNQGSMERLFKKKKLRLAGCVYFEGRPSNVVHGLEFLILLFQSAKQLEFKRV